MSDVFSKQKRSDVMSKIRGKGNKDTELAMILIFKQFHITGWSRNQSLLGKPDFTFRKEKIVIFVDGCFWHVCPKHSNIPKNNQDFWIKKLTANLKRDKYVSKELRKMGWVVIRIWEHELRDPPKVAAKVIRALTKQST